MLDAENVRLSGNVRADMVRFLHEHGFAHVAAHCLQVAEQAGQLAAQFGSEPALAQVAGWLHDISAVIPDQRRVDVARQFEIEVLPEERAAPMILHQKLSAVMANRIFAVNDQAVLSAIRRHTTLQAGASVLDKIVFLADKIAWDQTGKPPYLDDVLQALAGAGSLDRAVWCYLDYLWRQRDRLAVVHPWFVAAYRELTRLVR